MADFSNSGPKQLSKGPKGPVSSGSPKRRLVKAPRDRDGLFVQPKETGPDRELVEQHNRMNFAHIADFADPFTGNPRTFDPLGRYNCGRCNKDGDDKKDCTIVPEEIYPEASSCGKWENQCAGDPEQVMTGVISAVEAGFGTAKNGNGFGCFRCWKFVEDALEPDSQGRDLYCRKGNFRTFWNACCRFNGAPVVSDSDDDDGDDDE